MQFKCPKCGRRFNSNSMDRKTTSGRTVYSAYCPKCNVKSYKRVARSK